MTRPRTWIAFGLVGYLAYFTIVMTQTPGTSKEAFEATLFSNPLLLIALNLAFYLSPLFILWGIVKYFL